MTSGYSFPMLCLDEISPILRSMNMAIAESDFKKPDPGRWYNIYLAFFEAITSVPAEHIEQRAMLLTGQSFEYPEIHEESSRIMLFCSALRHILKKCGVIEFTFKDLREPRQKRCILIASAIINFLRFKDSRMNTLNRIRDECERDKARRDELLKANDELKMKLNKLKAKKAEQEPEILKVRTALEEKKKQLIQSQEVSQNLQKDISEIKSKVADTVAKKDQMKLNIVGLKTDCDNLAKNIVQSPQRVKEEQERMKEKVASLKSVKEEKLQRLVDLRSQGECMKVKMQFVDQGISLLQATVDDMQKIKDMQNEIINLQEQHQSHQYMQQDLRLKKEELIEALNFHQEKILKLDLQQQNRVAGTDECLVQLKNENYAILQQLEQLEEEKTSLALNKQLVTAKVNDNELNSELKINKIRDVYSEILEKLDQYHTELNSRT